MKYALLFAATASAYEAYGGYGAQSSSVPAKVSSTPYGGGYDGYKPVTSSKPVVPASKPTPCSTSVGKNGYTTVNVGYGKQPVTVTAQHQSYPTCVATSYDGKNCDKWSDDKYVNTVVTDYNSKVVTVTKKEEYVTIYHEKKTITHTATPTMKGYGAAPTPAKNGTGVWYELYEKIYLCEYQNMGKNAMTGYPGSGMCQKCDDEQPIVYRECKSGKCTDEKKTLSYGKPKEEVKVYEKPGVYTVPAKTVTVYSKPTGKAQEYDVYRYSEKTITITKPNQPYTCTYEPKQTPSKTPSKGDDKVTKTPVYNDYGYKASPTPKKPENNYGDYPVYDSKKNTTSTPVYNNGYGSYPTPTPATSSKPVYGEYNNGYGYDNKGSSSMPSKATSTPCEDDKKKPTPTPYQPSNNYDESYQPKPSPTPSKPSYDNNGGYGGDYKATPTPANNYNNNAGYGDNKPSPTPVYNGGNNYNNGAAYDTKSSPTPVGSYPADKSAGYTSNEQYGKTNGGYGGYKRSAVIQRRKAVAEAQEAKRAIIL